MTSTKHIILKVPSLVEQPAIGSGCCVVLAEDVVRDELERLDGLWRVRVDDEAGWVEACYGPDRLEAEKIVEALGLVGYPAVYSLRSKAHHRDQRARDAEGPKERESA